MEDLEAECAGAEDARQALVDAMMRRVAALLPPEYRGVYAESPVLVSGGPDPVQPSAPAV